MLTTFETFSNVSLWVRTQQNKWEPGYYFIDTFSLQFSDLVNRSKKKKKSSFLHIRQREREKHFLWQRRSRMFFTFIYDSGSQGKSRFMNKENDSYGRLIYCFNSLQSDCCDPQVFLPWAGTACLSLWWQSDKFLMDKCSLIDTLMRQPHGKIFVRLTKSLHIIGV